MTEMDQQVTLADQLQDTDGPVVLINKFEVAKPDVDQFLAAWAADAVFFKQQPGFISAQLHRGIAGSSLFLNYAVWESAGAFRRASACLSSAPISRATQPAWWLRRTCSARSLCPECASRPDAVRRNSHNPMYLRRSSCPTWLHDPPSFDAEQPGTHETD